MSRSSIVFSTGTALFFTKFMSLRNCMGELEK